MSDKKPEGTVSLNARSLASEKKICACRMGDLYLEPAPLRHLAGNYTWSSQGSTGDKEKRCCCGSTRSQSREVRPQPSSCSHSRRAAARPGRRDAGSAEKRRQRHKGPVPVALLMGEGRGDVTVRGHLPRRQKCGERGGSA